MKMVNTTKNSTQDMIDNLQELKGKTKVKFNKNIGSFYDNMNIRLEEDSFSKNSHGISKIYHEVLLLMIFLQTKPQVKNMNNNFLNLNYTFIKNRNEKILKKSNMKLIFLV